MLGWKYFLQGKILPDWMDVINNERTQLYLPPNLRAVPQLMTALITTSINLWRTHCEFMHGEVTVKKIQAMANTTQTGGRSQDTRENLD